MKRLALILFLIISLTASAREEALVVTARGVPDRILPALPVDLTFVVTNRADQPVPLPHQFVMEVTPVGGEPFLAQWNDSPPARVMTLPAIWSNVETLAAGQSQVMTWSSWPAESVAMNALPITAPGTYQVRFAFSDALLQLIDAPASGMHVRRIAEIPASASAIITNSITLQIAAPAGVDAVVWSKIKAASDGEGRWPGRDRLRELAADIWEKHRESQYAPWASIVLVIDGNVSVDRVRQVRDEVEKLAPRHALIEWYELLEGTLLLGNGGTLLAAGAPLHEIMRQVDLAEDRYRRTLKATRSDTVALTARAKLEQLGRERVNLAEHFESMKNSPRRNPLAIKPMVDCGKVSDRETHVFFAYDNPNAYTVSISIGPRNMFGPGDMDRGQPTSFAPGRNSKAFRIKARDGRPLTWQLDGSTLTIEPGKLRPCAES